MLIMVLCVCVCNVEINEGGGGAQTLSNPGPDCSWSRDVSPPLTTCVS